MSNQYGEFTEPEILDWLLECFPKSRKIIVESYTPWRGLETITNKKHYETTLKGRKKYWSLYKKQDKHFLLSIGIMPVLEKRRAEYINIIINEFWSNRCVNPKIIKKPIHWIEFYSSKTF